MNKTFMVIRFGKNPFGEYDFIEKRYSNKELQQIIVNTCKKMHGVEYVNYDNDGIVIRCTSKVKERIAKKFNLLSVPRSGGRRFIIFNGCFHVTEKMEQELRSDIYDS